jgi:hypothetical protein
LRNVFFYKNLTFLIPINGSLISSLKTWSFGPGFFTTIQRYQYETINVPPNKNRLLNLHDNNTSHLLCLTIVILTLLTVSGHAATTDSTINDYISVEAVA